MGSEGTPYHGGVFILDVQIPERYPFEPPKVRFVTPIYHPNIDTAGRICLDSLKMPPKGAWKPALNVSTILTSIQQLMAEPNPDDPLMTDIAEEFRLTRGVYHEKAVDWTQKHAITNCKLSSSSDSSVVKPQQENVLAQASQPTMSKAQNTRTGKPLQENIRLSKS